MINKNDETKLGKKLIVKQNHQCNQIKYFASKIINEVNEVNQ